MKKFVNKTKQQKRVVVYEDKEKSKTKTYFLRSGQTLETSSTPKLVEEGVREVETKANSTKTDSKNTNQNNTEDKE